MSSILDGRKQRITTGSPEVVRSVTIYGIGLMQNL